jgi:hypothetical protein
MGSFTASTVPGARVPHAWLPDGRSLLDGLGPAYTLVRFDTSIDVAALTDAAAQSRVPLAVLDVDRNKVTRAPESLLIVRPDTHIAWRGDAVPQEPLRLLDRLRGAAVEASSQRRVPVGEVADI